MTETATMTSKGQITIPSRIRRRLGIDAGDRIDFVVAEDGELRLEVRRRDARELGGMLARGKAKRRSVEEMDRAVAKRFAKLG